MAATYGGIPEEWRKSSRYEKFQISENVHKDCNNVATGNIFPKISGKRMKNLSK